MISVNKNPSKRDLHNFGWTMLIGFGVLGVLRWMLPWIFVEDRASFGAWLSGGPPSMSVVFWIAGPVLMGVSFGPTAAARPLYVTWMTIANVLGRIVTPINFGILYVVLLPPFTLIRLGDPLGKKLKKDGSYWEDVKPYPPTLERMMRQF